jgi:hypothetical protein
MSAEWTSLEIAKLAASTLTPVSVALLGLFLGRAAKRFEARQWANQKVIEKRLVIYDAMSLPLNDLLCYFSRVGNWKEQSPPEVIAIKRRLDKHAHVHRSLFSAEWFTSYNAFIDSMFRTWSGEGHDARILTDAEKHRSAWANAGKQWDPSWDDRFDTTKVLPIESVNAAYAALMGCFARELGVGLLQSPASVKRAKPTPALLVENTTQLRPSSQSGTGDDDRSPSPTSPPTAPTAATR